MISGICYSDGNPAIAPLHPVCSLWLTGGTEDGLKVRGCETAADVPEGTEYTLKQISFNQRQGNSSVVFENNGN